MKSDSAELKQWTTKQVILATLFVVCVFLSLWLLYRFRTVVFLFFIAIVIGTTIRPAVEWFYRRGLSRPVGIMIIYGLIAALLVGFLALVVPLIIDQFTQLSQNFPDYQVNFRRALVESNNLLLRNIGLRIPSEFNFLRNNNPTSEELFDRVGQTINYASQALRGLLSILAVFLLAYYWTQESHFVIRSTLRLIPRARRKAIRDFIQLVEIKIAGYVRGQGILSLSVGLAALIAYSLIGLPYTLVLAIVAGIMEMVPIVGPVLGAIPALLVALTVEPGKALWVVVATAIIQLAESIWLVPRIMTSSMGVNPIIILLSLVTFSAVFGFTGALLALPLAAIIQLILDRLFLAANGSDIGPAWQPNGPNLQTLLGKTQATTRSITEAGRTNGAFLEKVPDHIYLEMTTISEDLGELLHQLKSEEEA
jgi:predicted PurR-regulated permease PerM